MVLWETPLTDQPAALAATSIGGRIAVAGLDGTLRLHDANDGKTTAQLTADIDTLTDVALSADGQFVAAAGARGYLVWNQDTGSPQTHTAGWCNRVVYADDGRLAVAAGRRLVVHAPDGSVSWLPTPGKNTITDVAWLAKQRQVAASTYGGVDVYARHSKQPVHGYRYGGSHLAVAAAPTGRWVCTGNQDATVHVWKTQGKTELHMPGYPKKVTQLAFDPTGRWLANNGSRDLTVWDFAGDSPAGSKPRLLTAHDGIEHFAWRNCTTGIVATVGTEGTLAIWSVANMLQGMPGKPLATLELGDALRVQWLGLNHLAIARHNSLILVELAT